MADCEYSDNFKYSTESENSTNFEALIKFKDSILKKTDIKGSSGYENFYDFKDKSTFENSINWRRFDQDPVAFLF